MSNDLKSNSVIKDYFNDPVRFSSFSNYVYFDGHHVILPDRVEEADTDLSTYLRDWDRFVSKDRQNDKLKKVWFHVVPVYIGMEIQSYIDYTMPSRILEYTILCYIRQKRRNITKDEAENMIPVFIFVLYCGEDKWTASDSLEDCVNLPEEMKSFFQDFRIRVIDIKDMKLDLINDEDTRRFVETVQKMYAWDGRNLDELNISKTLSLESAVAAATIVKRPELIEYFCKDEQGGVDMCTSIARALDQSRSEGFQDGKQHGYDRGKNEGYHQAVIFMLEGKLGKLSQEVKTMVEESSQELLDLLIRQLSHMKDEEDVKNILDHQC